MALTLTQKETQKAYRERKRARMAEDPEFAAEVKAKKAASDRAYYEANKDKWAYSPEKHQELMQNGSNYAQNKLNQAKRQLERHPDRIHTRKKVYREQNAEKIAAYAAQWELDNRDKRYALNAKRYSNLVEFSSWDAVSRRDVWDRDGGICGLCHREADPTNWHLDHIIPLSWGGIHIMTNVQVSHPKCNISKGSRYASISLGGIVMTFHATSVKDVVSHGN